MTKKPSKQVTVTAPLLDDLRGLIEAARQHVAQTANATLTMLYWHVGQRIRAEVLKNGRTGYGEEILPTLSAKLAGDSGEAIVSTLSQECVQEYGHGFELRSLRRRVRFAEVFPGGQIVVSRVRQLSQTLGCSFLKFTFLRKDS
jgi:hypothetical protein